jgi:tRNA threonylcarbamoyladenosine biosynthesis protein TsaE
VDTIISNSAEETIDAGRRFAHSLRAGDVVALCGDLGAGKTHFTKGIVSALSGQQEDVTSPTFTLVHEYRAGRLPVFHFDFYRLEESRELFGIGWEDYLAEDGVMIVEWADRFPRALPDGTIRVEISILDASRRSLQIS